jgi:OmpA-OmpF porin, OOP family
MKQIITLLLVVLFTNSIMAQTKDQRWALGLHFGKSAYNGDLGNNFFKFGNNSQEYTKGITLGTYISKSLDGVAHANYSNWSYVKDASNSFTGNFYSYGLRAHYKFANGKLLNENARIKPYVLAGIGYMFAHSQHIDHTSAFGYELGYGLKFKLINHLHIQLQSVFGINRNDEIDQQFSKRSISNNTRGDWYALHTIGLVYSFNIHPKKDSDGDGIIDTKDKCPGTPIAVKVNETGCPNDADGDLIPDFFDRCPTIAGTAELKGCPDTDGDGIGDNADKCPTQKGTADYNGCPDTDGDGIADNLDKCPTTKGLIELNGCPQPDADYDGVLDEKDKCPNLKGDATNNGCPIVKAEDQKRLDVLIKNINFQTGSDVLTVASYPSLNKAVEVLLTETNYQLEINGHTDNVGDSNKNLMLSGKRADAVKNYLISKGIAPNRLSAKGFGDALPLLPNTSAANKAKNRRVELKLKY